MICFSKKSSLVGFLIRINIFKKQNFKFFYKLCFLAKINVFLSVVGISFYYIALFSIFCSVISTFYYIRIIKVLYFETLLVGKLYYPIKTIKTLVLSFFVFLIVYLFLNPNFFYFISFKSVVYFF